MKIGEIELIDSRIPKHLGVIMDGNGRWASERGYSRNRGHRAGMQALKTFLETIQNTPIEVVTLFCFSRENWKRSREELDGLFRLLRQFYKSEFPVLKKRAVKILHSGDLDALPNDILEIIREMTGETRHHTGKKINFAFNYSGRNEIVRACARLIDEGLKADQLDERVFRGFLDNPDLPDLDLVIRTSGELRVSNFCLWQLAYSELWFTERYWPDFSPNDLAEALLDFQNRVRRFGDSKEGTEDA